MAMSRRMRQVSICLVGLVPLSGCVGLTGGWRVVSVAPDENTATIQAISFDWRGRFSITEMREGEAVTSSGRYTWNGLRLRLRQDEGGSWLYPCYLSWDGSLRIKDEPRPAAVTMKLRRYD